jgi:hypothetical protein
MLVGAFVYVAAVLGLWTIDGRKDGAERRLISFATHQFARLGRDAR